MQFAVIFDNDGVLCDTEQLSGKAFQICLKSFGFDLPDGDLERYCGLDAKSAFETLKLAFGNTPNYDEFWVKKSGIYTELTEVEPILPINGAESFIDTLRSHDIPIAVASSAGKTRIVYNLTKAGLIKYFPDDCIFSPNEQMRGKPAPDLFLYAAKYLEISPNACIGIEDSTNGLTAIKAAGMKPIAIATTFPYETLYEYTPYVYPDLSGITIPHLLEILKDGE